MIDEFLEASNFTPDEQALLNEILDADAEPTGLNMYDLMNIRKFAYCPVCDRSMFFYTEDMMAKCPVCNHHLNLHEETAPKMSMELIWHNCKTCLPKEQRNDDLYLWDGHHVFPVEYSDEHFSDNGNPIRMDNPWDFWWADLSQTTKRFFILNLGPGN